MALTKSSAIAERVATVGLMERLPGLMENAGVSKAELIERTGINQNTIYALWSGTYRSSLSGDAMIAIAQALDCSFNDLTGF